MIICFLGVCCIVKIADTFSSSLLFVHPQHYFANFHPPIQEESSTFLFFLESFVIVLLSSLHICDFLWIVQYGVFGTLLRNRGRKWSLKGTLPYDEQNLFSKFDNLDNMGNTWGQTYNLKNAAHTNFSKTHSCCAEVVSSSCTQHFGIK